jgi:hypothetical protein
VSKPDPFEQWNLMPVQQLVTETKFRGSGTALWGHTTPEGWPYCLVVAVGSPGNQAALDVLLAAHRALEAMAPTERYDNPGVTPAPGSELSHQMVGSLRWIRQSVHQAHHGDRAIAGCESNVCRHIAELLGEAG